MTMNSTLPLAPGVAVTSKPIDESRGWEDDDQVIYSSWGWMWRIGVSILVTIFLLSIWISVQFGFSTLMAHGELPVGPLWGVMPLLTMLLFLAAWMLCMWILWRRMIVRIREESV